MRVVKPLQFNSLVFERESEATYYDEEGTLKTAAYDVLRYGYDPTTLEYIGPIIEAAQTNRLLWSKYFLSPAWVKTGSGAITDNATEAPTGVIEATQVTGARALRQSFSEQSRIAFSIYVKPFSSPSGNVIAFQAGNDSSLTSLYMSFSGPGGSPSYTPAANIKVQALPNGWYRATVFRFEPTTYVRIDVPAGSFYISGAMAEPIPGAFNGPSSYIYSMDEPGFRAADEQSDPPSVLESNVWDVDYGVWDAGDTYSPGEYVTVLGDYNRNYRYTGTLGTTPFPPDNPDVWIDTGSTNRWRMFDMKVGADKQTINQAGIALNPNIDVTVVTNTKVNSVCLFNLLGSSVKCTVYYDSEVYYERTIDLVRPVSRPSWYAYFFENRRRVKDVAFLDLPPVVPASIRIEMEGEGGSTAIGKMVVGYGEYLGFPEYGTTSIGITDYSTKEADAFGNYFVQERRWTGTMNVRPVIEPGDETRVRDVLADLRAISSAYIVERQDEQIMLLGFFQDFDVLFSTPASSHCTLRIAGI